MSETNRSLDVVLLLRRHGQRRRAAHRQAQRPGGEE